MPEIIYRKLKDLKLLGNNPRQIGKAEFQTLCKSVADNPDYFEARPLILSDRTGELVTIAGNMRYRAAKHNKQKEVPTILLSGLTEEREAEIIIRDNVNNGSWDVDILANEWTDYPLSDWGLDVPDFDAVDSEMVDAEPQMDKAAELNKKWKVKTGDLWQIGEHRLLCGDSTKDAKRFMDGETTTLCLTDPPYNIGLGYATYDDSKDKDVFANQAFLWFSAMREITETLIVTPGRQNIALWLGFAKCDAGAWVKSNAHGGAAIAHFAKWEPIFFYGKHLRARDCDVFEHHVDNGFLNDENAVGHPCAKPLRLWNDLIEHYSEVKAKVYDPFAGSGTTLVACQNLNRKCYAIEISENYCAVILERMQTAFPDIEIKRIEDNKELSANG